jgi:hypothetical protein
VSGLEQAMVIIVAAWLAVLTFVLLLVVRQVGLMTVRLSIAAPHTPADQDGPDLGASLPGTVTSMIGINGGGSTLVFLSGTCSTCRSLAAEMSRTGVDEDTIVLIGGRPKTAQVVGELLPESLKRFFEPVATRVADDLGVESVPFALHVDEGVVKAKAYLHTIADLGRVSGESPGVQGLLKRSGRRASLRLRSSQGNGGGQ